MMERNKVILLIVLVSFPFLFLGLNSEIDLIGKISSIFAESNVMVSPEIIIIYTKFSGDTTPFSEMNFTELQSIDNMTLEIPTYGKIVFTETIDLTACRDAENVVNLNKYVDITTNSVGVNVTALPCMNKSADISFYQINFNVPRILRDGSACPNTTCQVVSYNKGVLLVFNVTDFTYIYSVEEGAPEVPPAPAPAPAPGLPVSNFTVDKSFFKVSLKQGETLLDSLTIQNTGTSRLRFLIDINNLRRYLMLSEDLFYLEPGESKTISIAFTAPEYEKPDVYPGRLVIEGDSLRRIVLVIMEIRERRPLFDIRVVTRETPQPVYQGEEVEADIMMYNFGDLKPVDVLLYYSLRDFDSDDLLYAEESLSVQEQKSVTRRIRIPEDLEPDYYLFYARLTYDNESVSASALIQVLEPEKPSYFEWFLIILLLFIIIILILVMLLMRRRERRRPWLPAALRLRPRPRKRRELREIEREIKKRAVKAKRARKRPGVRLKILERERVWFRKKKKKS